MKTLFSPDVNRSNLLKIMLASSFLSMILLSFRMYITGNPAYIFLGWNLFLAWLPFLCALCLDEVKNYTKKRIVTYGLLCMWLAFFPNSPYIITDLFHLHKRAGMPLWFDLFLIISFAWNGLMLGFASLMLVQQWLSANVRTWMNWTLVVTVMFMCGYGVYLGRFERWNSWDILSQSGGLFQCVLSDIIHPLSNLRMLGVTLIFGTFLLFGYLTLLALMNMNRKHDE